MNCSIIILAAGSSSRLGRPKQLLAFNNKTLLQITIDAAVQSTPEKVLVVTGAVPNELLLPALHPKVTVVVNDQWHLGMGTSISTGMKRLLQMEPDLQSVIILLCDQPLIDHHLINRLIKAGQSTNKNIVASAYNNTLGPPALFTKTYFQQLIALDGNGGARKIIQHNEHDVLVLPWPEGSIDIDTEDDYQRLLHLQGKVN